jgi:hypothetical protein
VTHGINNDSGGGTTVPSPTVEVTYKLDEVYDCSNSIMEHLDSEDVALGLGIFAMVLTIGRVMSPNEMTPDEEQAFVKTTLDFLGTMFAQGGIN